MNKNLDSATYEALVNNIVDTAKINLDINRAVILGKAVNYGALSEEVTESTPTYEEINKKTPTITKKDNSIIFTILKSLLNIVMIFTASLIAYFVFCLCNRFDEIILARIIAMGICLFLMFFINIYSNNFLKREE